MATIKSKKKSLDGNVVGTVFKQGEAKTNVPAALAFFRSKPEEYTVTDDAPAKAKEKPGGSADATA